MSPKFGVKIKDILTCSVHPGKDVLIPPPKKKKTGPVPPTKQVFETTFGKTHFTLFFFKGVTRRTHNQHTQSMLHLPYIKTILN